jgi:hypothetical protein
MTMRVTIDRRLCKGSLPFCERCLGIFITTPQGTDRACITDMQDDGSEVMTLRIISAEGEDTLILAPADSQAVALDGWPQYVKFEPDFYRA